MRLLYINPHRDPDLSDPGRLLERYRSTRLWCAAVAARDIEVTVWQAFPRESRCERDGVRYHFRPFPRRPERIWPREIAAHRPDVVHLDGLIAPLRLFRLLSACEAAGAAALVQDHGGRRGPGAAWRAAAALAPRPAPAALLFSAAEQADPWLNAGVFPRETMVIEVMESSTDFVPADRDRARAELGLDGNPLVVSVGRLNRGKDPSTLLDGFASFADTRPGARLALVFHEAPLLRQVQRSIGRSALLDRRVTLLGRLSRERVRLALSAADIFASASRHEGSGYSALEAMACGAVPVLSDIPSFRAMAGEGAGAVRFPTGDAAALGRSLENACREAEGVGWPRMRKRIRLHFLSELGVEALGRKAAAAYRTVAGGLPR